MLIVAITRHGPSQALLGLIVIILGLSACVIWWVKTPYRVLPEATGLILLRLLGTQVITWSQVVSYRYIGTKWLRYGRPFAPADQADIWVVMRYRSSSVQDVRFSGTEAADGVLLLGEPLARQNLPGEKSAWYYSSPGPSQDYLVRVLILSNDRVVARDSECYLD